MQEKAKSHDSFLQFAVRTSNAAGLKSAMSSFSCFCSQICPCSRQMSNIQQASLFENLTRKTTTQYRQAITSEFPHCPPSFCDVHKLTQHRTSAAWTNLHCTCHKVKASSSFAVFFKPHLPYCRERAVYVCPISHATHCCQMARHDLQT